jgi:tRNA pseudouridine55 synthase
MKDEKPTVATEVYGKTTMSVCCGSRSAAPRRTGGPVSLNVLQPVDQRMPEICAQETCDGLLVIDKPSGMTSRDAVNLVSRWFPRRTRIGHTGTLDPLATGVLVMCVGSATRLAEYVQRMKKIYEASILLGVSSDTDDADGNVQTVDVETPPTREQVAEELNSFVGRVSQVPPAYSAAKVTGRRAYDLARKGEEVTLQAREIEIEQIDIQSYDYPRLRIEVHCGKGTYIRAVARDLGDKLGCGGIISALRRTRVGAFDATSAVSLDADGLSDRNRMLPLTAAVAELPNITLPLEVIARMRQGLAVTMPNETAIVGDEAAILDPQGNLAAIAGVVVSDRLLRPLKVLEGKR